MPDNKKTTLSLSDEYDEENFIERFGDAVDTILIVKDSAVIFKVKANAQFIDGPGWFIVDRRGHRWALAEQGDNQFALDLHDRTPREVMEES